MTDSQVRQWLAHKYGAWAANVWSWFFIHTPIELAFLGWGLLIGYPATFAWAGIVLMTLNEFWQKRNGAPWTYDSVMDLVIPHTITLYLLYGVVL